MLPIQFLKKHLQRVRKSSLSAHFSNKHTLTPPWYEEFFLRGEQPALLLQKAHQNLVVFKANLAAQALFPHKLEQRPLSDCFGGPALERLLDSFTKQEESFSQNCTQLGRCYFFRWFRLPEGKIALLFNLQGTNEDNPLQLLTQLPEENPNPVMILESSGKILYLNIASLPLIRQWSKHLPERRFPYPEALGEALEKNDSVRLEETIGAKIYQLTLMPNSKRGKVYMFGEEITERVKARSQLKLFETITKNMAEGILVASTTKGRLIYANPRAEEIFGYGSGEMVNLEVARLNASQGQDPAALFQQIRQQIFEKGFWEGEVHNQRKDGSLVWCHHTVRLLDHEEHGDLSVSVTQDITQQKQAQAKLAEKQALLAKAQSIARLGHWSLNLDSRQASFSEEALRILEIPDNLQEDPYLHFLQTIHPEDRNQVQSRMEEAICQKSPFRFHHRLLFPDGRIKQVLQMGEFATSPSGEPESFYGTIQDVTEEQARLKQTLLLAKVFESATEAVVITNQQNRIVKTNPAFERITGFSFEEVQGRDPGCLKSGRHPKQFYQEMWASINRFGSWEGEIWDRKKSGEVYPKRLSINRIEAPDTGQIHFVGLFTDISAHKKAEEDLRHLAFYDSLTSLPNRRYFLEQIDQAIKYSHRHNQRLALVFMDLDNFKHVNDTLGHDAGDELLCHIAAQLKVAVRDSDIVARLGGDEFILGALDLRHPSDAADISKNILNRLETPLLIKDQKVFAHASLGIAMYPEDGSTAAELLKKSDTAMYHSKAQGKNRYTFYDAAMEEEVSRKQVLDTQLHFAVERDEFTVVYQPQVSISTHQLVGIEALVRWESPDLGLVSPAEFIPVAEETALILKISEQVLLKALRFNRRLQELNLCHVPMSVNFSARQFQQKNLPQQIQQALEACLLEPKYLKVEITEGILMNHLDQCRDQLNELREMGVNSSIDDFGTGYSSLGYLSSLPVTDLKIDRLFVKNIVEDSNIAKAVIHLAQGMGINCIAEGAETLEQCKMLLELGCQTVQGYYFSRPLQAEELILRIEDGKIHPLTS